MLIVLYKGKYYVSILYYGFLTQLKMLSNKTESDNLPLRLDQQVRTSKVKID